MSSETPAPEPPRRRVGAAARMLRGARRRAGLTQRALAAASGVAQETIARIERSTVQPRFDTLALLLDACGFELELIPRLGVGVDPTLIESMLEIPSQQRLARGEQAAQGMAWMRASARHRHDIGDVSVSVASLDDLIRMKRAAGRTKDLLALEELGALRARQDTAPS